MGESARRGARRPSDPASEWLYGIHTVTAALANPRRALRRLLVTERGRAELKALPADLAPEIVEPARIAGFLPPGAVHQGMALEAAPLRPVDLDAILADPPALIVLLDQVTDPHNVGAILRTAAAFGAGAVIITERHAPGATGSLAKAASGALELVPLVRVVNLARTLTELGEAGYWRVGLAEQAVEVLRPGMRTGPTAVVLGSEDTGLRRLTREHCDALVCLPTHAPLASLNVSNAAAVALYALTL